MRLIRTKIAVSTVNLLLLAPAASLAGLLGPANYDECILESMKGVTSDQAAAAIIVSCRNKFPAKAAQFRALTSGELQNLNGRAVTNGDFFSGQLYNGNRSISVMSVTVGITTTTNGVTTERSYSTQAYVGPQSTGTLSFSFVQGDKGTGTRWRILSATGAD